jgi:GAF domain-containing protein
MPCPEPRGEAMRRRSKAGGEQVKKQHRKTMALKRRNAPKATQARSPSASGWETKITQLTCERDEALEQQRAAAEVLKIISASRTELQPVLEVVVRSAARYCKADDVTLFELDGQDLREAAHWGALRHGGESFRFPCTRGSVAGRVVLERKPVHIADLQAEAEKFPEGSSFARRFGHRTTAGVPLLREGVAVGTLQIRRTEVNPFTDKQIALLETFASQAVIAIENARLLNELRQRTADLSEALEQQTATSEVLRVISSSPGELDPVFQAMLENATRICEAKFGTLFRFDGNMFHVAAQVGTPLELAEFQRRRGSFQPGPDTPFLNRVMRTKQVSHTADEAAEAVSGPSAKLGGARSLVGVPMLKDDELIGAILIYRQEVRPFTDKQIELVQNFAAQAVIAIENARLLNELRQRTDDLAESLEQQTATSEVLKVISSSPGDLNPVFEAILENAVHICDAKFGNLWLREGSKVRIVAIKGGSQEYRDYLFSEPVLEPDPQSAMGRIALTKEVVQIEDISNAPTYGQRMRIATIQIAKARTLVGVPMLKDDQVIGVIAIYRQEVRPFTDKQIDLVKNFAAQAVIAIENTRLLSELRQRTNDLTESLEQQTATSEVLKVISSSPGDLQPVFEAMLANATRLCEAKFGALWLCEGDALRAVALNAPPAFAEERQRQPLILPTPETGLGRAVKTKLTVHSADLLAEEHVAPVLAKLAGARTYLAVPMLKDNEVIGAIGIYRQEVRPFTDKQVALVENFAAQAVIAIENTRLLNELRQSLEQQTATADVLRIISSSPGELEPVFQAMLENATRICGANFANLLLYKDGAFRRAALFGAPPAWREDAFRDPVIRPNEINPIFRIIKSKDVLIIPDLAAEQAYLERDPAVVAVVEKAGARSIIAVPMVKEDVLRRRQVPEPRPLHTDQD